MRKIEQDLSITNEILSSPQINWAESFLEKEALISKMKVQSTIVVYKMCYVEEINMFTCTYLYCYQYIASLYHTFIKENITLYFYKSNLLCKFL